MADHETQQAGQKTGQWDTTLRMFGMALALLIIGAFAWLFSPVTETILLGFVFAFIFHALALLISRFGPSYKLATILIYLSVGLVGIAIALTVGRALVGDARNMLTLVENAADSLQAGETIDGLSPDIADLLDDIGLPSAASTVVTLTSQVGSRLSFNLSSIIGFIGMAVVSLLFAFMLQLGLHAGRKNALAWVPASHQRDVVLMLAKLDQTWSGYLIAGMIFAAVLAVLSFLQYALMSVPYPLMLALLTGVLTLIPNIGGLLATVIVFIVSVTLGPTGGNMDNLTFAILVGIVNGVISQGTFYFVGLPITGRGVQLPVAVVLIGSIAGLATGSLLLAWLTVPVIATLRTAFAYLIAKINGLDPFPNQPLPGGTRQGFLSQLLGPQNAD